MDGSRGWAPSPNMGGNGGGEAPGEKEREVSKKGEVVTNIV